MAAFIERASALATLAGDANLPGAESQAGLAGAKRDWRTGGQKAHFLAPAANVKTEDSACQTAEAAVKTTLAGGRLPNGFRNRDKD